MQNNQKKTKNKNNLRFAHMADLHLGGWREKVLTKLNFQTFQEAIKIIITKNLDFCVFSGDIFNNAMPSLDIVNKFVLEINKLKKENIPIYIIGGSHDYSDLGKSFLELLNSAGVFQNVSKIEQIDKNKLKIIHTINENLKIRIGGIVGKKQGLEKNIYSQISNEKLSKNYLNIFLFHTSLDDLKNKNANANLNFETQMNCNLLPKGYDYYAGGHIHFNCKTRLKEGGIVSYSGALFPNNFKELITEIPVFNICQFNFDSRKIDIEQVQIKSYDLEYIKVSIDNLSPLLTKNKIEEEIEKRNIEGKIVLLQVEGIVDGKIIDIKFSEIIRNMYENGALQILKNTYKLKSAIFENININQFENTTKIEDEVISEFVKNISKTNNSNELQNIQKKIKIIKKLLLCNFSKFEEEKNIEYATRVKKIIESQLT